MLTEGKLYIRPDGSSWKTVDTANLAKFENVGSNTNYSQFIANISEKYIAMKYYHNSWKYSLEKIRNEGKYSKVGLGLGFAKGVLKDPSSSTFGKNERYATMVIVAIAE